ncbi:MAG TPA: TonB-dependent receptor [Candidatus Acidoferrales bacterium]|nr:TonB-dependent receptor [Candidatus Acidoferrales bacterium]
MQVSTRKALFSLVLLFAAVSVAAQNPRGTLVGTVQDATGGRVASAKIEIRAVDSSIDRTTSADSQGQFRIDDLSPGPYRLIVNASGFAEAASDVSILVSSARNVSVTLSLAAAQTTVNVQGAASSITTEPIDTTSAVHQGVVTAQDLATIPLAARSFANIAYLVPGTEPVEPSDPTKARITAVSTGGSSGLNNQLSVDGGDDSDDYIGGFLQNISPDAIQEFAFKTAGEDADTSGTTAGAVVITTKRGTDEWHGGAAFYERDAALNARFPIDNPAPNPKQPFSRQNYVGTLGGPIAKGKLWFFTGFEYVPEKASIAYSPATLAQFQALATLATDGLIPGVTSIATPSSIPVPFHDYLADTRLDWYESARSQWFVRFAADNYTTQNDLVQQGTLPSTGATSHSNYMNLVLNNTFTFSPSWLASLTLDASYLHRTETRNQYLGFALAFPFSSTSSTISGFETFGDNQFLTPITAFPVLRNQEKYQLRYDVSHAAGKHAPRFGVNFIHEPVLSGALSATAENLTVFPLDPTDYLANPAQFTEDLNCGPAATAGTTCTNTPAGDGSFSQNVQRLGVYAEDSWRVTPHLTVNYGLRYDTSFGLFTASGRSQGENPALLTIIALKLPLPTTVPHDYRLAFAPRLGIAYSPGQSGRLVFRAGFGLYYDDLAQNGWVTALQAVNAAPGPCVIPGDGGCLPGAAAGGAGDVIAPNYKTPYAIHATAGVEYAFSRNWMASADLTHEEGNHGYRAYNYEAGYTLASPLFAPDQATQMNNVPNITEFRSDNRSRYDALMLHLQGNVTRRLNLTANYTLSRADTWGCVLGELFDYVNGVCDPLNPFAKGDYGPSGEDVTHRFVLAGGFEAPGGFEFTTLFQAESGRPITLTTPVDVNGFGDTADDRAVVNGVQTTLDEFRGTPYIQLDLRVSRPFNFHDRWSVTPFAEFFNLFNRNNPGANYVTDISALPVPVNNLANATAFCLNASCTQTQPITSPKQLLVPSGALGDFFGPGTTVGIPFAAQLGVRVSF